MSNFFIVGIKGGPVTTSVTESQKTQSSFTIFALKYDTGTGPYEIYMPESVRIQSVFAMPTFRYFLNNGIPVESQKITSAFAISSFSYA